MFFVALAAGVLLGSIVVRATHAGETWADWKYAELPGWANALQYVLLAAFLGALVVPGLPNDVRLVPVGVACGFCVCFFTVGILRWRRRHDEGWVDEDVELPARTPWRDTAKLGLLFAPLGVVIGLLLGLRGGDLVAVALLGGILVPLIERWREKVERRMTRRGF